MSLQTTLRRRTLAALLALSLAVALPATVMGASGPAEAAQPEIATSGWSTDGIVWDMVRIDDTIYIGGEFSQIQDEHGNVRDRSNLAAFDAATGAPLPWAPTVDNEVKAMEAATDGSRIYIGGDFHRVNGRYRKRMAAVDPDSGSTVSSFRANTSGRVLELLLVNDHLYLAGELISVDGEARNRIARVDPGSGQLDADWRPWVTGGSVRGLEASPDGARLYVGGTFSAIDDVDRTAHLAAIDLTGGQDGNAPFDTVDRAWRPNVDQPIFDIVATGDDVYLAVAGPGFENNRLQKHSAITAAEKLRYLADGDVQDLELRGEVLFVGGHFEQVFGGQSRSQLAAIDITDDHITDLGPDVVTRYGVWKALAGPEGLWLGGEFTEIDGKPRQGFGFLANDELAEPDAEVLIASGARWRYDDSGTEPSDGTRWTEPTWDDGDWKAGYAEMGFGDGDEQTVTSSTDALYARRTVEITDPGAFDDYAIRVLADAGAAVYVNGTEVARDNLPAGPLDGETLALEGRWTNGERTFIQHSVARSHFHAGWNTIAVEVHGAYNHPGDMSFDLELIGLDRTDGDDIDGPDVDPGVETLTVIDRGAVWNYVDDGSRYESGWTGIDYDDANWKTGPAEMGFGDGRESTSLTAGHVGYRFRHDFDVAPVNGDGPGGALGPIKSAHLTLMADDGAVVYLNGTEIARQNMPDGEPLSRWTKPLDAVWGDAETTFNRFEIDPGLVADGPNTVAVAVHNLWAGSSDISFDLDLTIERHAPERPDLEPQDPEPPVEVPVGPVTLVAEDATWSYFDDGTNPGDDWSESSYDAESWQVGTGRFGFGNGGETTLLSAGHESYYFRNQFSVEAIPDELSLDLQFDDGVAVYLNGVEVSRRNLPAGQVGWWTTAVEARWGAEENAVETISLEPDLLLVGLNTLAISVHNQWSGNADLSMTAELTGDYRPGDDDGPPIEPPIEPDPDPEPPAQQPWTASTLIDTDADWRYNDSGADLGQSWTEIGFDDGSWKTGAAVFGFGQGDETTEVQRWKMTYYFRKALVVDPGDDLMPTELVVRLLVDDGAAVYVNGTEIVRQNLPDGPLAYDTAPLNPVWGDDEKTYTEYRLPADLLIDGENLLAVEAHNYAVGNSDLSFGLELSAD